MGWSEFDEANEQEIQTRIAGTVEVLRNALRQNFCPRPANRRPDQFTVGECFDADECGCMNHAALCSASPPSQPQRINGRD